jgi:hypothetical protein
MKSFRKIGLLALALSAVACGLPDEWDNTPYTPHPVLLSTMRNRVTAKLRFSNPV